MRSLLEAEYPADYRLNTPVSISDTISLERLQKIRIDNDHEASTGYAYGTIGNDGFITRWIEQAIADDFLHGFWQTDLQHYATMGRGPANQILMEQLNYDDL